MSAIELKNGYYISIDTMCYTLKQKYTGKNKSGEEKKAERTIGYYSSMEGAVRKYIELCQIDVLDGERVSIEEYVKTIEQVNEIAVQGLRDVLERFQVK